jgi:hypothetical protein
MKKSFVVKFVLAGMAAVFMSAAAFAEFNLRASVDISGDYEITAPDSGSNTADVKTSLTLSGEYLRSVGNLGNYLKIGGGFEVLVPRPYEYNSHEVDDGFWFLPLYLAIQTNPVPPVPELFFKFNLGYNLLYFDKNYDSDSTKNYRGKLYYSFVTGWEFPFGLFFDLTYAVYNGNFEAKSETQGVKVDIAYTRVGIGAGYKFGGVRNK